MEHFDDFSPLAGRMFPDSLKNRYSGLFSPSPRIGSGRNGPLFSTVFLRAPFLKPFRPGAGFLRRQALIPILNGTHRCFPSLKPAYFFPDYWNDRILFQETFHISSQHGIRAVCILKQGFLPRQLESRYVAHAPIHRI